MTKLGSAPHSYNLYIGLDDQLKTLNVYESRRDFHIYDETQIYWPR